MPEFTPSEMYIDPPDFLDSCTQREIDQVIRWLEDNNKLDDDQVEISALDFISTCTDSERSDIIQWLYDMGYQLIAPNAAESLKDSMFGETLINIFDKQNSLTIEEREIIEKIGKKFNY